MRKKHFFGVLVLLPLLFAVLPACTGLVQDELDETHAKLDALKALVTRTNDDLVSLNRIVAALGNTQTSLPKQFNEVEGGFEVIFVDSAGNQDTVRISHGSDGADARTLIGVKIAEDSLYYWTLNDDWLTEEDGSRIRAGASDGENGIVPQIKVEDGYWWISVDEGQTYEQLAPVEEINGVGVFSGIDLTDPAKVVLTLWNGTVLELPRKLPLESVSIILPGRDSIANLSARDTLTIAAGELLPIPYEIEVVGETDQPVIVTSGTDGVYISNVIRDTDSTGVVMVQAPEVFSEGYILLSAYCEGYSTLKVISFREREISVEDESVTLRLSSGNVDRTFAYKTNFDYTVSFDADWLTVEPDTDEGVLVFIAEENETGPVRTCTVTITAKDNPSYVCTTFQVIQATDTPTSAIEEGTPFTYETVNHNLDGVLGAPAEGGDVTVWITFPMGLTVTVPASMDWVQASIVAEDGFQKLLIHVDPNEAEVSRSGETAIKLQNGGIPIGKIVINQAAALPEE